MKAAVVSMPLRAWLLKKAGLAQSSDGSRTNFCGFTTAATATFIFLVGAWANNRPLTN
jgi:hypothetical protein